jgi:site-specific DNA recombinase
VHSLGYARVSGREQGEHGTSLEGQDEKIVAECKARGWPDPDIRVEVESSHESAIERRVELHKLIEAAIAIAASGIRCVIFVTKLDRWSRDVVFGVQSIRQLVRAGVGFFSISEAIDASTSHGDEQLGLRLWIAESEGRTIRDRMVGSRESLRAKGLWAVGRVPFGYVRGDRAARLHLHLREDPEPAAVIRELFDRVGSGQSLREVAMWSRTIPGAPRDIAQIHRLLNERTYLGEMRAPRTYEWIKGLHPPLITLAAWERAQAGLAARRQNGPIAVGAKTADLLLRQQVKCGVCGRGVTVALAPKGQRYYCCSRRRHKKYEGDCAGPYVRAEPLDEVATTAILERVEELRADLARPRVEVKSEAKAFDLVAARSRIATRRARAVQFAVDDVITAAQLTVQQGRLDAELAALTKREAETARATKGTDPAARATIAGALKHLAKAWLKLTVPERQEALRLLAARVELSEAGALVWTWRSVVDLVAGDG